MLRRINRVLVAVPRLDAAAIAVSNALGLQRGRERAIPDIAAVSEALPIGDAWFQLLQPVDEGPVARFLEQHGSGIYGIGVEVPSLADARLRVEQCGRQAHALHIGDEELVCLKREQLPGLTIWLSESEGGMQPADTTSPFLGIWQATNLVADCDSAAALYSGLFGRPAQAATSANEVYGYRGAVLTFASPGTAGGDSIELLEPQRQDTPLARFWRRHGPSAYMVTLDTDDLPRVLQELRRRGVRHSSEPSAPNEVAYIHPAGLGGCFAGIIAAPQATG